MQQTKIKQKNALPSFFIWFGVAMLSLFCASLILLAISISRETFPINPVYLLMATIGFLGLLITDIVAIVEWQKARCKK